MLNKVVADYGAPDGGYVDGQAKESASDEMAAADFNALIDDVASASRTSHRVVFQFTTTTTAGPVSLTADANWFIDTQWGTASGSSSSLYPTTASKLANGSYQFTWAQTFQNEINADETLNVHAGTWNVNSSTVYKHVQLEFTAQNSVKVSILNDAFALSEPANGTKIQLFLR